MIETTTTSCNPHHLFGQSWRKCLGGISFCISRKQLPPGDLLYSLVSVLTFLSFTVLWPTRLSFVFSEQALWRGPFLPRCFSRICKHIHSPEQIRNDQQYCKQRSTIELVYFAFWTSVPRKSSRSCVALLESKLNWTYVIYNETSVRQQYFLWLSLGFCPHQEVGCCLYFFSVDVLPYLCSPLSSSGIQGMLWPLNASCGVVSPCVCVCVCVYK